MKLYLINCYEAYMASEKGLSVCTFIPNDDAYYKHEIKSEIDVTLPEGIKYDDVRREFYDEKCYYDMVAEIGEKINVYLFNGIESDKKPIELVKNWDFDSSI